MMRVKTFSGDEWQAEGQSNTRVGILNYYQLVINKIKYNI